MTVGRPIAAAAAAAIFGDAGAAAAAGAVPAPLPLVTVVVMEVVLLLSLVILRRGKTNQSNLFSEEASRCDVGRCARGIFAVRG